jgi:hypothetical protein
LKLLHQNRPLVPQAQKKPHGHSASAKLKQLAAALPVA